MLVTKAANSCSSFRAVPLCCTPSCECVPSGILSLANRQEQEMVGTITVACNAAGQEAGKLLKH